jgi:hypothetical protein
MEKITAGGKEIEYRIKRGRRKKSIAISISSACQVVVLAPQILSNERIREIVRKKSRWILRKQDDFKKLKKLYPAKEYVSGEQLLFLGRKYRLKIMETEDKSGCEPILTGRRIVINVQKNLAQGNRKQIIKDALTNWYHARTAEVLLHRIKRYSGLLNLAPKKIIVRNQQKRWGSCSRSGVLRFNWRIALAPVSIVDYVVVHEICHLKEKNHSGEFWRQVSLVIPDYKKRRQWLKDNPVGIDI